MNAQAAAISFEEHIKVFSALGEPVRIQILTQIARADEWPCTALERELAVTKSTISYHVGILARAHLIQVRKVGRNYYYKLRQDTLRRVSPALLRDIKKSAAEEF